MLTLLRTGLQKYLYVSSMSAKVALECIKQNAEAAEKTITELKQELEFLTLQYNNIRAQQLREENKKLALAVEDARKRLIQLETKNGVQQIKVPNRAISTDTALQTQQPSSTSISELEPTKVPEEAKPKKEKKPKQASQKPTESAEPPVDVGRLDLRVAKVEDVQKHPDADSLYVLKINCGENKLRTVCSGLVKFVPLEALKDRDVMLLCNLKPVKMRGITSEAMVMCASTSDLVEVLTPPPGCNAGEPVHCEGYSRNPDPVMNPKKKIFEAVAPDLAINDSLLACYKGVPLTVPGKGPILATTLKNCPVK